MGRLEPGRVAELLAHSQRETARLWRSLRCPACNGEYDVPWRSHVCPHTICQKCAELARRTLAHCPVNNCKVPVRPVDFNEDRDVRNIVDACRKIKDSIASIEQPEGTAALQDKLLELDTNENRKPDDQESEDSDWFQVDKKSNSEEDDISPNAPAAASARICAPRADEILVPDSDAENEQEDAPSTPIAVISTSVNGDHCRDTIRSPEQPQMRICLTKIEGDTRTKVLKAIRSLGGEASEWRSGVYPLPMCVVTPLDPRTYDYISRTRSVHYAIAHRVPIVGPSWLYACSERGTWLPCAPYEARSNHRKTGPPVFSRLLANVDSSCDKDGLHEDICDWITAAGGTVVHDDLMDYDDVSIYVYIVRELTGDESFPNNDMHRDRLESSGIECRVVDLAWISECLVSGHCPPESAAYCDSCYEWTQS